MPKNSTPKISMPPAPIVLFTYNRPWHTQQTVEALQKNELASESDLFIYSDGPRDESVNNQVREVREYIKTISGFKTVTIREAEENKGLAKSIIEGVTDIVNQYGKVIVMEDDIFTSPYFLKFMNQALNSFKDKNKVWHICGWNYPINTEGLGDVFFWRVMNCWGWATWADRWRHFHRDVDKTIANFSREDIRKFSLNGTADFWSQVLANKTGELDTWEIFWYATIFKHGGLCLTPSQTLVKNIGNDNSGTHSYSGFDPFSKMILSNKRELNLNEVIEENSLAVERIIEFHRNLRKYIFIRLIKLVQKLGLRGFILLFIKKLKIFVYSIWTSILKTIKIK